MEAKLLKKKSKKKLFIWIGSILGGLIIIGCVGGYFAINYTADKVLDAMFESAVKEEGTGDTATTPPADSGLSPSESPSSSPSASDAEAQGTSSPEASEPAQTGNSGGTTPSQEASAPPSKGASAPPSTEASTPPSSDPSPTPSSSYTPEISTDKAEEVKEDISFSEKTKVMTVMLKRLSVDDIKTLQQLASGGLTLEKKKEAKAIILEKLSEKEYDELIEIAKKYGLSQGKSYADSQQEDLTN